MTQEEWESLCDGCGRCCLVKIEDEESGEIYTTSVSCHLLDIKHCRCNDYTNRMIKVSSCAQLKLSSLPDINWLPDTCAYKRLYAGEGLPAWHPLLTRDKNSVHEAGVSVKWFAQSEDYIHPDQLVDFIIDEK